LRYSAVTRLAVFAVARFAVIAVAR
jgi:hypothetical protein